MHFVENIITNKSNNFFHYLAVHPPSTNKEVPVIIDAASKARKTVAEATSIILRPTFLEEYYLMFLFLNFLFFKNFLVIGVTTKVGGNSINSNIIFS